jgi:hypothetical protein
MGGVAAWSSARQRVRAGGGASIESGRVVIAAGRVVVDVGAVRFILAITVVGLRGVGL